MFQKLLASILRVSPEVIVFISDNRKRYYKKLLIVLPLTAWASLLYQIYPIFTKFQIDSLTNGDTNFLFSFLSKTNAIQQNPELSNFVTQNQVWLSFGSIVLAVFVLDILDTGLNFWKENVLQKLNQQSEAHLEDKFNDFLTRFDSSFLSSENNLRLIRNLQYSFDDLENKTNTLLTKGIDFVISVIAIIGIIPFIHPYLVALIILSVSINMFFDRLQNNAWRRFELVENRKNELRREIKWRMSWDFNRILSNGWLDQIYNNYQGRRQDWFDIKYQQNISDRKYGILKNTLNNSIQTTTSLVAGWLVVQKVIQIGSFVVFGLYVSRIKGVLENIASIFRTVVELRFELFRMEFLLNIKPKLDYTNIQEYQAQNIQTLELKELTFNYPKFFEEEKEYMVKMRQRLGLNNLSTTTESKISPEKALGFWRKFFNDLFTKIVEANTGLWEKKQLKKELDEIEKIFEKAAKNETILKNLSFKFEKGKIYALVGYNGAGKTTLTKLIKRTIDPTLGSVLINGRELKTIDPIEWKSQISSLEQESFIWESFSIRDNLNLGSSRIFEDSELFAALEKVGLKDVISDLDSVYGEGIELSGGQKQLLEIARVILQKKPILILDEGTNQVDAIKENHILSLLHTIKLDCIVIFITHRITTCSRCDHILVLEKGQILADGTHKQLLESKTPNLYQTFWNIQVLGS